jgi:hypothetical protein
MGAGPQVGGAFTPASIGGLTVWLKADAITGKVDGDAISSWTDSSGGSKHGTQATGSAQPIYKTAIANGKPIVRFSAPSSQVLNIPDLSALTAATGLIVVRAVEDPQATAAGGLWEFGATNNTFYPFSDGIIYDDFATSARKTRMTTLFVIAILLLVWDRRNNQHTHERLITQTEQMLDQQNLRHSQAEKRWMDERSTLLNRIKPETAQPLLGEEIVTPEAVHPDLDQDYWESKEDMAERLAQMETAA